MIDLETKDRILNVLPSSLRRLIDPTSHRIDQFAASLSRTIVPASKVLDAGAGEAPYKKYFSNHSYTAIDTKWGDSNWNYSNLDVVGNLNKLPFSSDTFDGILCTQVLEHVNEPFKVIKEFHRVLKPGGMLYLSAPQGWGVHQEPHDYFRFTHYGLKHLLGKAGFEIKSTTSSCGYFGYLANRLTVFPKTLFWQIKKKILRVILFPLEMLSYVIFVLIFPLILNRIDFLDRKQDYTLNYMVRAEKK